jgi:hypothetical protein
LRVGPGERAHVRATVVGKVCPVERRGAAQPLLPLVLACAAPACPISTGEGRGVSD